MGWWNDSEGVVIGDGPLDRAEEFLRAVAADYSEDLGRQPTLAEVLRVLELTLEHCPDVIAEGEHVLARLTARTKARPKKQPLRPGDIFAIPLGEGIHGFGRLTPQHGFAEFLRLKSRETPSKAKIREASTFRLPFLIDLEPLQTRRWKIVGHVPYEAGSFEVQPFVLGSQVAIGTKQEDGFMRVASQLRPATLDDAKRLPPMAITNEQNLIERVSERLADIPIDDD